MRGIKTKDSGKWKRFGIFLALFLVLGFLLHSVSNVYKKKKDAEEILVRMEKEKTALQERSKNLEETLQRLGTQEGIDFEIRKRFNVAGAGEGVAIIVEENQTASSSNKTESAWQKFKNFFIDWFN
jgi:hypothetical protein